MSGNLEIVAFTISFLTYLPKAVLGQSKNYRLNVMLLRTYYNSSSSSNNIKLRTNRHSHCGPNNAESSELFSVVPTRVSCIVREWTVVSRIFFFYNEWIGTTPLDLFHFVFPMQTTWWYIPKRTVPLKFDLLHAHIHAYFMKRQEEIEILLRISRGLSWENRNVQAKDHDLVGPGGPINLCVPLPQWSNLVFLPELKFLLLIRMICSFYCYQG